jgi:hypothetical protein
MGSTRSNLELSFILCASIFVVFATSAAAKHGRGSLDDIIPPSLLAPTNTTIQQSLLGVGQQIYTYNGTSWLLTNVSAALYNFKGREVGHHFWLGQPDLYGGKATWITFSPYTRVSGKTLVSVASPFPVAGTSIPWLLVQGTSNDGNS